MPASVPALQTATKFVPTFNTWRENVLRLLADVEASGKDLEPLRFLISRFRQT
jgi:hypothetical protein